MQHWFKKQWSYQVSITSLFNISHKLHILNNYRVLHLGPVGTMLPSQDFVLYLQSHMARQEGIEFLHSRDISNWNIGGYNVCDSNKIKVLNKEYNHHVVCTPGVNDELEVIVL